jgi:FkbM family methyltransferase
MLSLEQYEKLSPQCSVSHNGVEVKFHTPNSALKWRVDTLFTKEPSTVEWISGFAAGEVLVDIGANVGMYTIWAAKTRGTRVYAFEPESLNFGLLNRNIVLNSVGGLVKAYCLGLSDRQGFSELHLSSFMAGGSCHSLGEQVDYKHEPMQPAYSQGCVSARLDDLVRDGVVPPPDYIKIDVDGFEPKVIAGAAQVLQGPQLKSLSIEINQNLADHRQLVIELNDMGFGHDPAQVARAERKEGLFKGCAEYVFRRR